MLYYRIPVCDPQRLPPELVGWRPTAGHDLHTGDAGGFRVVALAPQFQFDPSAPKAWRPLGTTGWEVAQFGAHVHRAHARIPCAWPCLPVVIGEVSWALPAVVNPSGLRSFSAPYGPDLTPELTQDQLRAMEVVMEIRRLDGLGTAPDPAMRARWAAWLLTLTYAYSVETVGLLRALNDDLINTICAAAAGLYESPDAS